MKNRYLWIVVALASVVLAACGGEPPTPTTAPLTPTPATTPTPSAGEHVSLGVEHAEQGQFDEAIAEFEEAIQLDPEHAEAHYNLGVAYAARGQLDEAIAEYKKAIEITPDHVEAHVNLGLAYKKQGHLDEAIAEYKEAIEIDPDSATAHNNLGVAYKEQGRFDEAIAEFEEAIRLDPDDAMPHNNLGIIYYKQGYLDEAIAEYKEAIRLDPGYAGAHNSLGAAYYEQGKPEEAVAEWEEAIRLNPDYATPHRNLGVAYRDLGRSDEAVAEFEAYLRLQPNAPDRTTVEQDIAELEGPAAEQWAEYQNAAGGYSLFYPDGWYYAEDENMVTFAASEEALEADPGEAPMVMFIAGPLDKMAESLGLEEITEPVAALERMAASLEAEMGVVETGQIAGYAVAFSDVSKPSLFAGGLAIVIVEERSIGVLAVAPPDQWDTLRPTFGAMLNSLSFFEP